MATTMADKRICDICGKEIPAHTTYFSLDKKTGHKHCIDKSVLEVEDHEL